MCSLMNIQSRAKSRVWAFFRAGFSAAPSTQHWFITGLVPPTQNLWV